MRTRHTAHPIPQQGGRDFGARGLSVSMATAGPVVVLTLRGDVTPENRDVLITAVDAALKRPLQALAVSTQHVTGWSWRGLEVLVHAAGHMAERRIPFAVCGLRSVDLDVVVRTWPGVSLTPFTYADSDAAFAALTAAGIPMSPVAPPEEQQVRDIRRRLDDDRDIELALEYLRRNRGLGPDDALAALVRAATQRGVEAAVVARDLLTDERSVRL